MDSALGRAIRARLLEARHRAGLSQEQVGQRLTPPVSRQAISKWENGKGSPNPRELAELCAIYGVSSDWVLKGVASRPDTGSAVVDRLLSGSPADWKKDFENSER